MRGQGPCIPPRAPSFPRTGCGSGEQEGRRLPEPRSTAEAPGGYLPKLGRAWGCASRQAGLKPELGEAVPGCWVTRPEWGGGGTPSENPGLHLEGLCTCDARYSEKGGPECPSPAPFSGLLTWAAGHPAFASGFTCPYPLASPALSPVQTSATPGQRAFPVLFPRPAEDRRRQHLGRLLGGGTWRPT